MRVVRRTQSTGCAPGGFPSGLGWEVRLGCLRVVAGLDGHCHVSLCVYTLVIIKNEIKQLVATVVRVGTSHPPLSSGRTATIIQVSLCTWATQVSEKHTLF